MITIKSEREIELIQSLSKKGKSPEEIAEWIYFVAVINRFMTGQNLLIDGGEAGNAEFVWI